MLKSELKDQIGGTSHQFKVSLLIYEVSDCRGCKKKETENHKSVYGK